MDSVGLDSDDMPFHINSGLITLGEMGRHYCTNQKPSGIQIGGNRKKFAKLDEQGNWFCKTNLLEVTRHKKGEIKFNNLTYRIDFYSKVGDTLSRQDKFVYVQTGNTRPSQRVSKPTEDKEVQCNLIGGSLCTSAHTGPTTSPEQGISRSAQKESGMSEGASHQAGSYLSSARAALPHS